MRACLLVIAEVLRIKALNLCQITMHMFNCLGLDFEELNSVAERKIHQLQLGKYRVPQHDLPPLLHRVLTSLYAENDSIKQSGLDF